MKLILAFEIADGRHLDYMIDKQMAVGDALGALADVVRNEAAGGANHVIIALYEDRGAMAYNGWVVRGEWRRGENLKLDLGNDVDLRRVLFNEFR